MKKVLAMLCCFSMLFSMSIPVSADEPPSSAAVELTSDESDVNLEAIDISFNEIDAADQYSSIGELEMDTMEESVAANTKSKAVFEVASSIFNHNGSLTDADTANMYLINIERSDTLGALRITSSNSNIMAQLFVLQDDGNFAPSTFVDFVSGLNWYYNGGSRKILTLEGDKIYGNG